MRQLPAQSILDRLTEKLKTNVATVDRVGRELRLTPKQVHWAKLYASGAYELNVTKITMEAYPDSNYATAGIQGMQNLSHPCIGALVDMIMVTSGASDLNLMKQTVKVLNQDANLPAKVQALRLMFEVKGRLKDHIEVTIKQEIDVSKYTTEQLLQLDELIKIGRPIEIEGRTVEDSEYDDTRGIEPSEPV